MFHVKYRQRAVIVLCLLALAVTVCGCRKKEPEPPEARGLRQSQPTGAGGRSDLLVVQLGLGIGPVRFGMSKEEVVKHFGEPDGIDGGGMSLNYIASKGLSFLVDSSRGVRGIDCWAKEGLPPGTEAGDFAGSTKKGIVMGAGAEQIASAYGRPDRVTDAGSMTILYYNKLRCFFTLKEDRLVKLSMSMTVP